MRNRINTQLQRFKPYLDSLRAEIRQLKDENRRLVEETQRQAAIINFLQTMRWKDVSESD